MTLPLPTLVIYRDQLLSYSETFIAAQVESLRRYRPLYVGTARVRNSLLVGQPQLILGELVPPSSLWKMAYKLNGYVHPDWYRTMNQQSPQLIHAHFGGDGGFALALSRRLSIPLMVTFHGYDATAQSLPSGLRYRDLIGNQGQFFRDLLLRKRDAALKSADRVLAVSEFIGQKLRSLGCPADKIRVHYTGIDLKQFQPDPRIPREPIVLFVGRLVEKKGCEYLIRAMAAVQQRWPVAQLVVIGDGPLRSHLQALAVKTLTNPQFLGIQPPDTVRHWMNRAHCLCGPSIVAQSGDAEGFGMVFAEAQAMGLPVVSFATGGIPEVVLHGQTGLLAPEKDVDTLARHLMTCFEQPELCQSLAQAGRRHVEAKFDLQRNTRDLEGLYDSLIGLKP